MITMESLSYEQLLRGKFAESFLLRKFHQRARALFENFHLPQQHQQLQAGADPRGPRVGARKIITKCKNFALIALPW